MDPRHERWSLDPEDEYQGEGALVWIVAVEKRVPLGGDVAETIYYLTETTVALAQEIVQDHNARLDALVALDSKISGCAVSYDEEDNEIRETDPAKFDCASFCENFGHHTLLEIRGILSPETSI